MNAPRLLLGPLLRYVGRGEATVWVETDRPCVVTVTTHAVSTASGPAAGPGAGPTDGGPTAGGPTDRGPTDSDGEGPGRVGRGPTWSVHGHHYALVQVEGLAEGSASAYSVSLDEVQVWPEPDSPYPPSVIRTLSADSSMRLAFGSCRRVAPFDEAGLEEMGADALAALAERMRTDPYERWPDALFMAGDQIYADEPSPQLVARLHEKHAPAPPGRQEVVDEVWDFEEYTWLYHESWSPAPVRWLLSTVPTCMLLDDHDLRDDWNTSFAWRQEVTATAWWRDRVVGAFASYWVYQHLGNLSPHELARDTVYGGLLDEADDAARTALLDDFAWRSDAQIGTARWSFVRDFGTDECRIRLVAMDCRASRDLTPGHRLMVDDREWEWIVAQALEPVTHLLLGSTLPYLLPRGIHHLEGWNEAWASGRYGGLAQRVAEQLRQAVDLEHWSAFRASFQRVVDLLRDIVTAPTPPITVVFLSGDVHCSYTVAAHLDGQSHPATAIRQLVMSPFRNHLPLPIKIVNRLFERRALRALTHAWARIFGVADTGLSWEQDAGPWFHNGVMTVVIDGPDALVEIDRAVAAGDTQRLERVAVRRLTPQPSRSDTAH